MPSPTSMLRPLARPLVAALAVLGLVLPGGVASAAPASRSAGPPPVTAAPLPPPKASIVVDADTGGIWSSINPHEPKLVASTIKLLTALIAEDRMKPDELVAVSPRAASMPALKMSLQPGERWKVRDLLRTMLIASANDSAVALAERFGGGTSTGFIGVYAAKAKALGLRDHPKLVDPAGLDDEFSVRGGNLISAYDLAIVARAFLQVPELARIVRTPEYKFTGGDGERHVVRNHNRFLTLYQGAVGMKTGSTSRSGHSVVAAAARDGHTLIAVVIDSPNPYQQAAELLDAAFLRLSAGQKPSSTLVQGPGAPTTTATSATSTPATTVASTTSVRAVDEGASADAPTASASGSSDSTTLWTAVGLGAAAVVLAVMLLYRRRITHAGPPGRRGRR